MEKKIVIKKIGSVIEEITALNRTLFSEEDNTNQLTIDYLRTNTQYLLQLLDLVSSKSTISIPNTSAEPKETIVFTPELRTISIAESTNSIEPAVEMMDIPVNTVPPAPVPTSSINMINNEEQRKTLKSIQTFIGLNDRILLIKELFDGNKDAYEAILDLLNNAKDAHEAESLLKEEAIGKKTWKEQEELVNYFHYVVKRRFNG